MRSYPKVSSSYANAALFSYTSIPWFLTPVCCIVRKILASVFYCIHSRCYLFIEPYLISFTFFTLLFTLTKDYWIQARFGNFMGPATIKAKMLLSMVKLWTMDLDAAENVAFIGCIICCCLLNGSVGTIVIVYCSLASKPLVRMNGLKWVSFVISFKS